MMKNIKIVCIGDSLTEGDYGLVGVRGIPNVKKENYPFFLAELSGAEVLNFGKCGFKAAQYLDFYLTGEVDTHGADIIIIMLGTNGGFDENGETVDNKAFKELIKLCRLDAPKAKIALCTPPHATSNTSYSNHGYMPQILHAREFVRQVANELKLPVIEVALCPEFCEQNEPIMQSNDGLHFSELGYRTLAKFIYNELKKLKFL